MNSLLNGSLWLDTDGNEIHAHGGYIIKYNDYFYWYGEDRRENNFISCYRSKDLFEWEFRNIIINTHSKTESIRQRTDLKLYIEQGDKIMKCNLERPKVLYNKLINKFVLWVHYENGINYKEARCAIATCDTPDGDYIYNGSFNPYGYMSRDCTLYQDDDGIAYFISAARENADLHIYQLTDDFLNVDKLVNIIFQGEFREAPAIFKKENKYYMLSSYCTGWLPNQGKFATADSIGGKWSIPKDFGNETTFETQPSFVLPLDVNGHTKYLYYSDRWDADNYFKSSYVALPLEFCGDNVILNYNKWFIIENE